MTTMRLRDELDRPTRRPKDSTVEEEPRRKRQRQKLLLERKGS